jgi:dCTP deaminase
LIQERANEILIRGGEAIIGRSIEYFRIPRDVIGICFGKSSYARLGILVNVTPLEPEWEGHITISIINANRRDITIYSGEGIGQVIFVGAEEICSVSYKDRKGKYQAQKNIEVPKV